MPEGAVTVPAEIPKLPVVVAGVWKVQSPAESLKVVEAKLALAPGVKILLPVVVALNVTPPEVSFKIEVEEPKKEPPNVNSLVKRLRMVEVETVP